jgi:hypothetical protein
MFMHYMNIDPYFPEQERVITSNSRLQNASSTPVKGWKPTGTLKNVVSGDTYYQYYSGACRGSLGSVVIAGLDGDIYYEAIETALPVYSAPLKFIEE